MSSRLTRTLLKLYPRPMRDRYGDELLDLQDELRAQGEVSRWRLVRDMLVGALVIRRARPAYLMTAAVLVAALAVAGTIIGAGGTGSPGRASHAKVRLAVQTITANPYGSCFVGGGSSCSRAPCTQYTGQPSSEGAATYDRARANRTRPSATAPRCATNPHVHPFRPVFVGG